MSESAAKATCDPGDANLPIIGDPPAETRDQAIARLLTDSRTAHLAYRMAQRDGRKAEADGAFQKAARLRSEAHALDREKTASAWHAEPETFQSDELLKFYADAMAR